MARPRRAGASGHLSRKWRQQSWWGSRG